MLCLAGSIRFIKQLDCLEDCATPFPAGARRRAPRKTDDVTPLIRASVGGTGATRGATATQVASNPHISTCPRERRDDCQYDKPHRRTEGDSNSVWHDQDEKGPNIELPEVQKRVFLRGGFRRRSAKYPHKDCIAAGSVLAPACVGTHRPPPDESAPVPRDDSVDRIPNQPEARRISQHRSRQPHIMMAGQLGQTNECLAD
jgi:hypothetical protein